MTDKLLIRTISDLCIYIYECNNLHDKTQAKCILIFIENNSIIDFAAIKCGYLARNLLIYNCSKDMETDDSLMRILSEWYKNVSKQNFDKDL